MKKLITAFTITIALSICALAQSNDDYKKTEFFVGYSYGQADLHFNNNPSVYRERTGLNGFNVSGVYNVNRYFGIKGDVSGTYANARISVQAVVLPGTPSTILTFDSKSSLYNVLGGVQIKDNASEKRFKPFAHALVGAAFSNNRTDIGCVTTIICPGAPRRTSLAGAIGGGIDIRVNKKIDFRAVQIDYNPIKVGGTVDDNFRVGIGVVFR